MPLLSRLKRYLLPDFKKETEPGEAYDHWALSYDSQPGNLMLDLDEQLTAGLLGELAIESRTIADVGCGTGRHWEKILSRKPGRLLGFDVSAGMLGMLQKKYPLAETFLLTDNYLQGLEDESCNVIISTLTIAHIGDIRNALQEWHRVVKPGGDIIITDYHPAALAKGAKRTFRHNDELIAIRNYIHTIEHLTEIARQLHLEVIRFTERKIDESVKEYYENQHAIALFERFYGIPIIYGIHLKKSDAAAQR